MTEPERDPRNWGESENEIEPLSDEEIRAGVEHDRARAAEDDTEWAAQ